MIIECKDVIKIFKDPKNNTTISALRGCDLLVREGELISIIGPSGSGKTTLVKIIAGLDYPSSGTVKIKGKSLSYLSTRDIRNYRLKNISLINQFPERTLFLNISVKDNLEFVYNLLKKENNTEAILEPSIVLEKLGISHLKNRIVKTLSGGEMTRVALACAVSKNTPIILCDEPTGQLDSENAERVRELLYKVTRDFRTTILVVTHDIRFVEGVDRTFEILDGRVSSILSAEDQMTSSMKLEFPLEFKSYIDSTMTARIPEVIYRTLKLEDRVSYSVNKKGKVELKNPENISPDKMELEKLIQKEKVLKIEEISEKYIEGKKALIKLEKVSKIYSTPVEEINALSALNLDIFSGDIIFVLGPSGSGKTTLMKIITGLETVSEGQIMINGTLFSQLSDHERAIFRRTSMGIIAQQGTLNPFLTIFENMGLKEIYSRNKSNLNHKEKEKTKLLQNFQIEHRKNAYPLEISGGELQRASLALALVDSPKILLLDEPTANLDSKLAQTTIDLIITTAQEMNLTTIISTHDVSLLQAGSRVIRLLDGKIIQNGVCKKIDG